MNHQALQKAFITLVLSFTFSTTSVGAKKSLINGAGATFPYPIYSKWFNEYQKIDDEVQINYQSIGSGGGIRQLLSHTVDFGATDAPMRPKDMKKVKVPILHIPTVLGAVVITYHIPSVKKSIRLTPEVIADIFMGKINRWNDPRITQLNPEIQFPSQLHIMPAYRSDGSGTTAIFTDYLSKVSPQWKKQVGAGKAVRWPTGLGGKGNEGVTGIVKQTPGAIGYIEMIYAKSNKLPYAQVKNVKGHFIEPTVATVTAAARGALKTMPADYRVSITNAKGKQAYPIAAFTYLLIYQTMKKAKGEKIVNFLNWAVGPGQEFASQLSYAPLPPTLAHQVKDTIKTIQLN